MKTKEELDRMIPSVLEGSRSGDTEWWWYSHKFGDRNVMTIKTGDEYETYVTVESKNATVQKLMHVSKTRKEAVATHKRIYDILYERRKNSWQPGMYEYWAQEAKKKAKKASHA